MLSPGHIAAYCTLAALQGLLVVLPRPARSTGWTRLRSPAWMLVLPAALMVGTFGVLAAPGFATGLAVLAAVGTPVLVGLAVVDVVRGSRWTWLATLPVLGAAAVILHSWPAQLATSVLTALGCLTVGAALVRLTPLPWLAAGIAAMCIVDVALIAAGFGQPAGAAMGGALSHSALPEFHRATLAGVHKDYPDLVLAAVLGNVLAGHARQRTAGVLVATLVSANGLFFLVAHMLPGTVPVGVAAAAVAVLERRRLTARRRAPRRLGGARPTPRYAPALQTSTLQPGAAQPMEA